jgi:hypothetical protein
MPRDVQLLGHSSMQSSPPKRSSHAQPAGVQRPRPLHRLGHFSLRAEHEGPAQPSLHTQMPSSQWPLTSQPSGQARSEQSAPIQPASQAQVVPFWQLPCTHSGHTDCSHATPPKPIWHWQMATVSSPSPALTRRQLPLPLQTLPSAFGQPPAARATVSIATPRPAPANAFPPWSHLAPRVPYWQTQVACPP